MTPGHAPRHQDAQHHPDGPSAMTQCNDTMTSCVTRSHARLTHPQLMLKKSPLCPRERVDWAIDPAPNRTRMKVPESLPCQSQSARYLSNIPIVSAKNSRTQGLRIRKLQPDFFFAMIFVKQLQCLILIFCCCPRWSSVARLASAGPSL